MSQDPYAKLRLAAWRDALRVLAIQAIALVIVAIGGLAFGKQVAVGALIGAAIGLITNAYLAFAMLGKPLFTGKFGDPRLSWMIKVVLTLSLLWAAMHLKVAPPPSLIAGYVATMVAQWLAVSFWLGRR
jgi:F0F1-type ATP synthase assembly protein I